MPAAHVRSWCVRACVRAHTQRAPRTQPAETLFGAAAGLNTWPRARHQASVCSIRGRRHQRLFVVVVVVDGTGPAVDACELAWRGWWLRHRRSSSSLSALGVFFRLPKDADTQTRALVGSVRMRGPRLGARPWARVRARPGQQHWYCCVAGGAAAARAVWRTAHPSATAADAARGPVPASWELLCLSPALDGLVFALPPTRWLLLFCACAHDVRAPPRAESSSPALCAAASSSRQARRRQGLFSLFFASPCMVSSSFGPRQSCCVPAEAAVQPRIA